MNNTRKPAVDVEKVIKKEKGFMVFGLKSWIKALEIADGHRRSQGQYRYVVASDAASARIVFAASGETVPGAEMTRQQWAAIGKPARLASIALRATKDQIELASSERVEYAFDVITGTATLSARGAVLTSDGEKTLGSTIQDWAREGQPIEQSLFQQLTAAREWGNKNAEEATREKMIKYGVIRKPKAEDQAA